MMNENKNAEQNIIIQNQKSANVSGVIDVLSMDENVVVLQTVLGELTVKGKELKIINFSGETGDLSMTGCVLAVAYTNGTKGSFFSRLVK